MSQESDANPQLTAQQTEALDVLAHLFRHSRKDNPEARVAYLSITPCLAQ
jgi:hypothetical protein